MSSRKRVIIIGAGFTGLYVARGLAQQPFDVTIIDRNNFHTFTPLLYQVATCALDPSSIAYPVRTIFKKADNISFMLGEVQDIDADRKCIMVQVNGEIREQAYDYLVVATGSVTNFFGQAGLMQHAFELKTLSDAVRIRHHILTLFERAAWLKDVAEIDAMTTLVVVGGGPTGLETAGALHELYNDVLKTEFKQHQPRIRARVLLLEAQDSLLAPYPERLREAARRQLDSLGVEVLLNARVKEITATQIELTDGRIIPTHTVIWTAGVKASPVGEMLNIDLAQDGRIPVNGQMQVENLEGVFAGGDTTYLLDEKGVPHPMIIPVAQQQGQLIVKNIMRQEKGQELLSFSYRDLGIMATIGRRRAVAWLFSRLQLKGFLAWLAWLFLHLINLIGFRNRVVVLINWVWNYITYDRSVRLILRTNPSSVALAAGSDEETAHDIPLNG